MTKTEMTTIEVNGIKMEVDLRHAKRVEEVRVGSRVKIVDADNTGQAVHHGLVIGFEPFTDFPTIIVAYIETGWGGSEVKFAYINSKNKKWSMIVAIDDDQFDLDKQEINASFDKKIETKQNEIKELQEKKDYFNKKFQSYWEPVVPVHETQE